MTERTTKWLTALSAVIFVALVLYLFITVGPKKYGGNPPTQEEISRRLKGDVEQATRRKSIADAARVNSMIEALGDPNPRSRAQAARDLAQVKKEGWFFLQHALAQKAISALRATRTDDDAEVQAN